MLHDFGLTKEASFRGFFVPLRAACCCLISLSVVSAYITYPRGVSVARSLARHHPLVPDIPGSQLHAGIRIPYDGVAEQDFPPSLAAHPLQMPSIEANIG